MNRKETWKKLVELGAVGKKTPANAFHLRGADLKTADLRGADLRGADLSEADLSGADLSEADLFGADLTEADLNTANLFGADLTEAALCGANLHGANLHGANLFGTDLSGTDLTGADLNTANLFGADLTGADLSGCILTGTNLTGAILAGVNNDNANPAERAMQDVTCDNIIEATPGQGVRTSFGPQEFEKKHTRAARTAKLVLATPLAESTGFVARSIVHSINEIKKAPVISWRGAEILSDNTVTLTFDISGSDFFEKEKEKFEIDFGTALNGYFRTTPVPDFPDLYSGPVTPAYLTRIGEIRQDILRIARRIFS